MVISPNGISDPWDKNLSMLPLNFQPAFGVKKSGAKVPLQLGQITIYNIVELSCAWTKYTPLLHVSRDESIILGCSISQVPLFILLIWAKLFGFGIYTVVCSCYNANRDKGLY